MKYFLILEVEKELRKYLFKERKDWVSAYNKLVGMGNKVSMENGKIIVHEKSIIREIKKFALGYNLLLDKWFEV